MTFFEGLFYLLVALAILLFMISIHELGHYVAGKALGFKINEFAIGMGPALLKRKNKKTGEVFSLRLIPLGGYCAFDDESGEGENKTNSFVAQKPWKRIIVFVAGAGFNFISAVLIVIFAFAAFGTNMPMVHSIVDGTGLPAPSAAWQAIVDAEEDAVKNGTAPDYSRCLLPGDIILEVNGKKIYLQPDLAKYISQEESGQITMLVVRDGKRMLISNIKKGSYLMPAEDGGEPLAATGLGIYLSSGHVSFSFGEALARSLPFCLSTATAILDTFGQLLTGALGIRETLGGPVTTIDFTMTVARSGIVNILYLITMISINLAVFNLLPIPALDGSKIIFTTIEWIRGKPINRTVENYIHVVGLLLLFGFVILLDVLKFF